MSYKTIQQSETPESRFAGKVRLLPTLELTDMLVRLYNYRPEMVEAVETELVTRGVNLKSLVRERERLLLEEDRRFEEGKKVHFFWVLLPFLLLGIAGGIVGGCIFSCSKITGYCGKRYYRFDASTRAFGKSILYVSLALTLAAVLFLGKLFAQPARLATIYKDDRLCTEYRYDEHFRLKTAIYYSGAASAETTIVNCAYASCGRIGAAGFLTGKKEEAFIYYYDRDGRLQRAIGNDSTEVYYRYDEKGRVSTLTIFRATEASRLEQDVEYSYDKKDNITGMIRRYYSWGPAAATGATGATGAAAATGATAATARKTLLCSQRYQFTYDRGRNPRPPIPGWFLYNFLDVTSNWHSSNNLTGLSWQFCDGDTTKHVTLLNYQYSDRGWPVSATVRTGGGEQNIYYFKYLRP